MKTNEKLDNGNTKKEKSGLSGFLIILGSCLLFGGVCGYFMASRSFQLSLDLNTLSLLGNLSVWVMGIVNIICGVVCLLRIRKVSSMIKSWDGENDDLPPQAESLLAMPMSLSQYTYIFNMMMLGICGWLLLSGPVSEGPKDLVKSSALLFLISAAIFLISMVWILFVQNKTVTMIKKLNPEKQGSIFRMDFRKTWMNSMDELELQTASKAGLAAFKTVNAACFALWALASIGMLSFNTGILPVILPCIVLFAGNISYMDTAKKLEHPNR